MIFGIVVGAVGVGFLYFGVNLIVFVLGFVNIVLYVGVYMFMKCVLVLNMWIGVIVGGILLLMGWVVVVGEIVIYDGLW